VLHLLLVFLSSLLISSLSLLLLVDHVLRLCGLPLSLHAEKFLDAVRWFGLLISKFVFCFLFFCLLSLSLRLFALNLHFFLTLLLFSINIFFCLLFLLVGHQVPLDGHQLLHQGLLLSCSF